MRETEQYLKRATRGLWGKAAREARLELRGAIEDKVYRYRLLGLDEAAATRAALRDLGDPSAIARDLSQVHTLPQAGRAALLAGIAALLGVQALAQVPTVRAIPEKTAEVCQPPSPTVLQRMTAQQHRSYEAFVKARGGIGGAVTWCHQHIAQGSDLLRLEDIIAALRAAGVQVDELSGVAGYLILSFPGEKAPQGLNLSSSLKTVGGQTYIPKLVFLSNLRQAVRHVPLRLDGLINPVLQIGPAKLQLGTPSNPVSATDIYAFPVLEDLQDLLKEAAPPDLPVNLSVVTDEGEAFSSPPQFLKVAAPEGSLYVTVSNELLTLRQSPPGCRCDSFLLSVRHVQDGRLPGTVMYSGTAQHFRIVGTPAELMTATERQEAAFLVYKLDPGDLRNLKLTPVPAAQVRLMRQP